MKSKNLFGAVGVFALFSFAAVGCTPEAREDVSQAGENVGQATEKSVEGTAEAVGNAGEAVVVGAEKTGEAVAEGAQQVAKGAERAVEKGAEEVADVGQVMGLTAKVKNALYADKVISGYKLNVDTSGENDTVSIMGKAPSEAEKKRITQVAQKAAGSGIKIVNNVTVNK